MEIGVLNEFSSAQDKFTNHQGNSTRFDKFSKILNENSVVDIDYIGLPYTWWNSRINVDAIFERFDRIVANPPWLNDAHVEIYQLLGRIMGRSFYR